MESSQSRHATNEIAVTTAIKMTCEEIILHRLMLEGCTDLTQFENKGYTFHRHVQNETEQFLSIVNMKTNKIESTYYIVYVKDRDQVEYVELNKSNLEGLTNNGKES